MSKKNRCKTCGSSQLADSRYQGIEKLINYFLPLAPKRCRDCFNRGTYVESFFANKLRAGFWSLCCLLGLCVVYLSFSQTNNAAYSNQVVKKQAISNEFTEDSILKAVSIDNANSISIESQSSQEVDELGDIEKASLSASQKAEHGIFHSIDESDVDGNVVLEQLTEKSQTNVTAQDHKKYIRNVIETWREAWESSQVDAYLAAYSTSFSPEEMHYEAWRKKRFRIVGIQEPRQIDITNIRIVLNADLNAAGVEFIQAYKSPAVNDVVLKRMYFKNVGGEWKIARELVFETQS